MLPGSSDAVDAEVSMNVASVLEMTMSTNNLSGELTPTAEGALATEDVVASVTTNNATGYTLMMSARSDDELDLTRTGSADKIMNSTNMTAGGLAVNTWGYDVKFGTTPSAFLKIPAPTLPDTLLVTDLPSEDLATTVTVATKVDTSVRAGVYSSTLTFTAVGNYVPDPPTAMQTMTSSSCTTTRTFTYDVRDGNTYWVQKMPDGKCWMLTNLAYGGGGNNKYGDVREIANINNSSFSDPLYMIPNGANVTDGRTNPSVSTTGKGQFGYLYNWCAAMGAQIGTAACSNLIDLPAMDESVSICPSGWRLPTGDVGGEFEALNMAVNLGKTDTPSGLLTEWLGMYSGTWNSGFLKQNESGYYWASMASGASAAFRIQFDKGFVDTDDIEFKRFGGAVRCVMDDPIAKTGDDIQTVNIDTCPAGRTRVVDARDSNTYWVQKLADGRCWMLTNLAYAGGGTNTYGDVKSITNSNAADYTAPYYMIPTGANPTSGTTNPSTSTNGTGQYGYFYNWCAAMGVQLGTAACYQDNSPMPDASISICPSGWRLPTGGSAGSEFQALNDAVNGGSTTLPSGLLSTWLGMYGGNWYNSFFSQSSYGYYWSSSQYDATRAYTLNYGSGFVAPGTAGSAKSSGRSVRCVAE